MKTYYNDFVELFEYLFQDHKINNDYFFYSGGSSKIEYDDEGNLIRNFNKVEENYDKLISDDEGRVFFIYDERQHRIYRYKANRI